MAWPGVGSSSIQDGRMVSCFISPIVLLSILMLAHVCVLLCLTPWVLTLYW